MKNVCAFAVVLALALWVGVPATGAEAPVDLSEEELLMTPAETLETPDLVDPGQGLLENKIRICDPDEEDQCPSGCACVIIREVVNCFC